MLDVLVANRFGRDCAVLALGGGVVGDLAGFAAACYQRGVAFVQVPTTLLAQVDSAVGGKTAVNHPGGKNLIGAFHQPLLVVSRHRDAADAARARAARRTRRGDQVRAHLRRGVLRLARGASGRSCSRGSPQALAHVIRRSCEIKAAIVGRDEREQGERALLNLGHTFGHAVESATAYRRWLHGEAVAAGLAMAAAMSSECGLLEPAEAERVRRLVELAGLPTHVPSVTPPQMLEHMRIDKKVLGGRLRLVLLRRIGAAFVTADYPAAALHGHPRRPHGSPGVNDAAVAASELAPYAAHDAQSRGRRFPESRPEFRGEFQRDRDRIIHSNAFRRLVYKTQVFVNHEGDLYRTRITHSIEVAQIARSVALALRLNEALTEAICLAHDLGHTPFGHAGQDALNECMREYGGFEHNLQSLRVVDELEERYAEFRGLNLTFECREGILKHCSLRNARTLGELGERFIHRRQPGLEAQIANLADEIAYNNHDVDDGIRAQLLDVAALREVRMFRRQHDAVAAQYPQLGERRAGARDHPPHDQLPGDRLHPHHPGAAAP